MNIMKKIALFIKRIFGKQDKIKKLPEPEVTLVDGKEDKKDSFIESLRAATVELVPKRRVETLICSGDGLGIQKKISY